MEAFWILGLPCSGVKEADVKKAYHRLALKNHPDKVGVSGEEKMKYINAAYETIMNNKLYVLEAKDKPDIPTNLDGTTCSNERCRWEPECTCEYEAKYFKDLTYQERFQKIHDRLLIYVETNTHRFDKARSGEEEYHWNNQTIRTAMRAIDYASRTSSKPGNWRWACCTQIANVLHANALRQVKTTVAAEVNEYVNLEHSLFKAGIQDILEDVEKEHISIAWNARVYVLSKHRVFGLPSAR